MGRPLRLRTEDIPTFQVAPNGLSIRQLRHLLEADAKLEEEWLDKNSCVVCGLLIPPQGLRYREGGRGGRLLCEKHAREEGYMPRRPRGRRSA